MTTPSTQDDTGLRENIEFVLETHEPGEVNVFKPDGSHQLKPAITVALDEIMQLVNQATQQRLLDLIGEDDKQIVDDSGFDGRFCATCDCTLEGDFDPMECRCEVRNQLRAELRAKLTKGSSNE